MTNVLRHSTARSCSIQISRSQGQARLTITNDGASPPGPAGGGLTGLRERAEALGGRLSTRYWNGSFRLGVEVTDWNP